MKSRAPPFSILIPLTLFLHPALSAYTSTNNSALHDNSKDCSCYVLDSGEDSNSPEYFQYYRFFDFRDLADEPGQYLKAPAEVNDTQDEGEEFAWTPKILNSDAWNTDWGIQNWSKPADEEFPVRMVNSAANIYIMQNDDDDDPFTWLTLRTNRLEKFQSSGEIENLQKNLMHCSMRMYARVVGSKGAVAGFFTYFDDDNESDIEILTSDKPDMIRYTNQPALNKEGDEVAEASLAKANLAPWDDWQTHRIDWLPDDSYWYLNGEQVASNTYSVPREQSYLVLNMWSDGGTWSRNMSVGDSAEFQIQWVELVFNTSGPVEGLPDPNENKDKRGVVELERRKEKKKNCEVVCKVDGVKEKGTPEVVSVNRSLGSRVGVSWGLSMVMTVVVALLVGI